VEWRLLRPIRLAFIEHPAPHDEGTCPLDRLPHERIVAARLTAREPDWCRQLASE
jgi:hypothetical protein